MTRATSNTTMSFSSSTRSAFLEYVRKNLNNRRVSQADKEVIIEWLMDPSKRPSSQQEFSRRNYVQKSFVWDENLRCLLAIGKTSEDKHRIVVAEDAIVDVVESVHEQNDHLGWDATWRNVSTSYYGILRSDVIFLLKKCQVCAQDPSKRPKASTTPKPLPQLFDSEPLRNLITCDIQDGNEVWESVDNREDPCS